MKNRCHNHPGKNAMGTCRYCGRSLCAECLIVEAGDLHCKNAYDCLIFQEQEDDVRSSRVEAEPEPPVLGEPDLEAVLTEKVEPPEPVKPEAPKKKREGYYLSLLRTPRGLRDAIVMAEIMTRPKFGRR